MANVVGTLQVDLVANTASFTGDMGKASGTAKYTSSEIKTAFDSLNFSEARGGLMLLGEEMGVNLPRHVNSFLSTLPGVGAAMSAAFPVLAVVMLGEKVMDAVDKFGKMQEAMEKAGAAYQASALGVAKHADAIATDNLKLQDQLTILSGGVAKNGLAIALAEAKTKAIELAEALQRDIEKETELMGKMSVSSLRNFLTGDVKTDDIVDYVTAQKKAIADLEQEKQLALNADDKARTADIAKELSDRRAALATWLNDQMTANETLKATLIKQGEAGLAAPRRKQTSNLATSGGGAEDFEPGLSAEEAHKKAVESVNALYENRTRLLRVATLELQGESAAEKNLAENATLTAKVAEKKQGNEGRKDAESIATRISNLQKQATAEITVAGAQRDSVAATVEAIAAAQTQEFVDRANVELKQKHAAALTDAQKATILAAESEKAFAGVAKETNKTLADSSIRTREQAERILEMSAAYSKGGAAIAEAQAAAQIAPFQKKVDDLSDAFDKLKAKNPGATKEITLMAAALAQARAELTEVKNAFDEYADAQRKANTDKQSTDLERQIAANRGYAAAVLDSSDALRQYEVQQKVLEYTRNSGFDQSTEAVENYRRQLQELYDSQDQRAIADKVHAADRQSDLQKEINMLQQLRAATAAAGQSTLAIDGLIHDAEVQKLRSYDDELLKTNSIRNGMKVWFDQFTQSGTTSAQRVNSVMTSTIDGFNNSLTSFLTMGKGNWASFAQSAVSSILGLGIQWVESHVLMAAASKVFHVNEITDSTAAMAAKSAANVAEATSDAAVAAAGAFAYYSSFAPEIAAEMAAAQYAEGIAWAPVAAFRYGGIVPGDGSDGVPAMLHPKEMVLPERVSSTVMKAVSSGGASGDGAEIHNHYSPVVQVPPGGSVEQFGKFLENHFERWTAAQARKRGIRF